MFTLLVVIHEFGHFIVARRNGVEVEEFGIGFPPRIFSKTLGKGIWRTRYSINLFPLGGFVRLKGENDSDKTKGSFGSLSIWSKAKVMMAGVAMNFLAAAGLFGIVAAVGLPVVIENQFYVAGDSKLLVDEVVVADVSKGSPADRAGIRRGDVIKAFAGEKLTDGRRLAELSEARAGQSVAVEVKSPSDKSEQLEVRLIDNPQEGEGYLGVAPADREVRQATWSAPIVGLAVTAQYTGETLRVLGEAIIGLFSPSDEQSGMAIIGPVGIFAMLGNMEGFVEILHFTAFISLSLGIMNALPIPALDGGRLFVTLLFSKILRRPLTDKIENAIHSTGLIILLGLIAVISVFDVIREFF